MSYLKPVIIAVGIIFISLLSSSVAKPALTHERARRTIA